MSDDFPAWDSSELVSGWAGLPPLDGVRRADACVVGLGGSGLAAIEELLDQGLSVIGVDAGRVAAGAAGRNGGFLTAGPAVALSVSTPGFSHADKVSLWRLTLAERDHLVSLLGPSIVQPLDWVHIAGMVGGPRTDEESSWEAAELAEIAGEPAALRSIGIDAEGYDGPLGRGFRVAAQARVNPAERAFLLARTLGGRGAALFEHSPATSVRPGLVSTARGAVEAPLIVVAVDGRLERVVPSLRGHVTTYRLQMLSTAPLPRSVLGGVGVSARSGYEWMQQDDAGRLLIGGGRDRFADAERTVSASTTAEVQRWIESIARRLCDRAAVPLRVEHRWAASVGYTDDRRPLCLPVDEGVVAIGGYSGNGNLVGPVSARAAVRHLVAGEPVPGWFRSALA